ncbi:MAG: hypothetical protein ACOYXA_15155 [Bacteroidota bacterium]
MNKLLLFLFIILLSVGTHWLSFIGRMTTTALAYTEDQNAVVITKGVMATEDEERAEEEDTREQGEDDDETSKMLNEKGGRSLPGLIRLQLSHQMMLYQQHHFEIVVPPPKA